MKANFAVRRICDAPQALGVDRQERLLFLRHDVDIDPKRAMKMAEIEKEFDIRSTYMLMVNSELYSIEDSPVRSSIRALAAMGHEIALHFDAARCPESVNAPELNPLEPQIEKDCSRLEKVSQLSLLTGAPTTSMIVISSRRSKLRPPSISRSVPSS
jgi:hypothetical protein